MNGRFKNRDSEVYDTAKANVSKIAKIVENRQPESHVKRLIFIDEMEVSGKSNSKVIKLQLKNDSDFDKTYFFGTPLGLSAESSLVPSLLPPNADNRWTTNLDEQFDNQGAGLTYFQLLNLRFIRHAVLISSLEIITGNSQDAEEQRQISPILVDIPLNSATDSNKNAMPYMPLYTEFTGQELLDRAVVLGEFTGLSYIVKSGVTVNFNMTVHAVDLPNFKI